VSPILTEFDHQLDNAVFDLPKLHEGVQGLVQTMNHFHGFVPT
jgi:hypothetical protein